MNGRDMALTWVEQPSISYRKWVARITCTTDREYVILHVAHNDDPFPADHFSLIQRNHVTGCWTQFEVAQTLDEAKELAHADYRAYRYKRKDRRGAA